MSSVNLPPFSTPAAAHPPSPRFESRRCKIQWPLFLPFFCPFSVVYLLIPRLGSSSSSSGRAAVLVSTVPSQATETHRSTKHKADQQQQLQTSSCTEDADHHSIHVQPKHTILRRALDQIPPALLAVRILRTWRRRWTRIGVTSHALCSPPCAPPFSFFVWSPGASPASCGSNAKVTRKSGLTDHLRLKFQLTVVAK